MEEYIVSARKYRPLTFDSVVGQHALTTTLKNAIASGKLAHAYLFCGPRGVGKTTCARIFAKAINCLSPLENGDACGQCESCRAFDEQRSMSIHELDAASNNSVEDIRELCKQVLIPPQVGRYKVFIIDEVHMLSQAAFNAFLKTLEEPPSYVIFILATTEKHRILPTILSRCQIYDFQRITTQDIINHLQRVADKEGYQTEPDALNQIALKADGGMRDALSIFDQMVSFTNGKLTYQNVCESLNILSTEYYFKLTEHFLACEVQSCLLLLNEILQKGFEGNNFIAGLATHLRNLLVARDESTLELLETSEQMQQRYHEQALRCKPRFLYSAIKLCNDCDQAYRTSNNKRLQLEICLIQVAQLNEEDSPAGGLSPTKILKPIFSAQASQTATAHKAEQRQNYSQPKEPVRPSAVEEPSRQFSIKQSITPSPSEGGTQATSKTTLRKVSFRNFGTVHKEEDAEKKQKESENLPLTPLDLSTTRLAWQKYINQMPDSLTAMAQRMKTMQPDIGADNSIIVNVSNQQVLATLEGMRSDLELFMHKELKNREAHLIFRQAETEKKTAYNKADHIMALSRRNKFIAQLANALELELD